jgi:SAM-dependent methyltransferase
MSRLSERILRFLEREKTGPSLPEGVSALSECVLLFLSRKPGTRDYPGGTEKTKLSNALDFLCQTVPGFLDLFQNKRVLDFGCGHGWQAIAMVQRGARYVVGVDILHADTAAQNAAAHGCSEQTRFFPALPFDLRGTFDLVLSCRSFEHFSDPTWALKEMREAATPGGLVVISFAEPWWSPTGSHMSFFTRLPWANIWFSERTLMAVRARFRDDGAVRFAEVAGGLNKMTLAKFERLIAVSGLQEEFRRYYATKRLPIVTKIPVLRELLVSALALTLRKPAGTAPPATMTERAPVGQTATAVDAERSKPVERAPLRS